MQTGFNVSCLSHYPLDDIFKYVSPFSWNAFVPDHPTLAAYVTIFAGKNFGTAVLNTVFVAGIGIVIFLFRQFFAQIPRELAESARLEGASWLGILFRIYLPLSKPVVISAALLIFLFQWESFLWPLIATRSENLKVIQVALAGFEERYVTLWNELFAAAIIAALIPLIILLPLQRFYVQGVTAAATKD